MKNHINANMVVYIVIGKMNRIKEKTLIERKETLKKEREEYNKRYFEKKESKNKTTDVLISKLQDRLIQCCIDFINENNLGDLERVDFTADGLQISSEFGKWSPATDSFISGSEFVEENGYLVMKDFVKYS